MRQGLKNIDNTHILSTCSTSQQLNIVIVLKGIKIKPQQVYDEF